MSEEVVDSSDSNESGSNSGRLVLNGYAVSLNQSLSEDSKTDGPVNAIHKSSEPKIKGQV